MKANDLLKPRRRRGPGRKGKAPAPAVTGEPTKSVRADPMTRAFEQGPFPAVTVQPFPPATVYLWERLTGRAFDPELFAVWERVRAFTAYEGVELDGPLISNQWLADPDPARQELEPIAPTPSRRRSIRGPQGQVAPSSKSAALPPMDLDAHDLGD